MYSELIYTRCRQGIDILKMGRTISSDGFKVYSCTPSLFADGETDMQFLFSAAQGKQPYNDPNFMNDAYLYFVPENGKSFMVDFHPVPYDTTASGNYSHRAGNFLNHILIGDYSNFYPFELFGDTAIWNAKGCGEAYYYENTPTELPARSNISDPAGQITLDNLAAFVSDGRAEALKTAVSFLISQYSLPPEERKFLVICDETSEKIEMWIGAIEHAFSPRMAAAIPFATRMDKFAAANRYTVNQLGAYQTQINLQDPKQKLRYRAMLVGVDERDKTNSAAARPLANSPFVVLDGKEKRALFEEDTSNPYYQLITQFNDNHQSFCREFLQMLDMSAPGKDIYQLFDIYTTLEKNKSLSGATATAKILSVLGKYRNFNCSRLKSLYKRVTDDLPRFVQEDLYSALLITKWLQVTAQVVGDYGATQQLIGIVREAFAEQVFKKTDTQETFIFWESIKNSEFASGVASYLVAPMTLQKYGTDLQRFASSQATGAKGVTFTLIYLECAAFLRTVSARDLENVVDYGLRICVRNNDKKSSQKILQALEKNESVPPQEILLTIAKNGDRSYSEFLMQLIIESDLSVLSSNSKLSILNAKLSATGTEHLFVYLLKYQIRSLKKPVDIERFIGSVNKYPMLSKDDLTDIFECLDKNLVVGEKGNANAAIAVQQNKPQQAACTNSAHIYAVEVLGDRHKRSQFISIYKGLMAQGFPAEEDSEYVKTLTEKLFKIRMTSNELAYVIQLFSRIPAYIEKLSAVIFDMTTPKQNDEWNVLINTATNTLDRNTCDAIIKCCADLKQGEKALQKLTKMLDSEEARDYFSQIAASATRTIKKGKPKSGFWRFF